MSNRGSNAVFSGGIQQTDVMKDSFGYEVPVESVPLPSLGKVYPDGNPLSGQETVEIRAMTAREEDILTSRALIKKGTVITHLIKSCLTNKAIDVKNMISGDRNALMISLRITGYGQEYGVEVDCPDLWIPYSMSEVAQGCPVEAGKPEPRMPPRPRTCPHPCSCCRTREPQGC